MRLREEVECEKCSLQETSNGRIERVVFVVALRLCDENGDVLARLGEWSPSGSKLSCQLPGTKRARGELPHDAASRILRDDLEPFAEGVELTHTEREVEVLESPTHGIMTRYVRTVYFGTLRSDFKLPDLECLPGTVHSSVHRTSVTSLTSSWYPTPLPSIHGPVQLISDGSKLRLCTWLNPSDFEQLRGSQGNSR